MKPLLHPYSKQRLSTGDMIAGDDDFGKGFFTDLLRHISTNLKTENSKDEPFVTGRDLFNVSGFTIFFHSS